MQKQVVTFADGSQLIIASRQSIAIRMIDIFSHILDSLPEREQITCTACNGNGRCLWCNGRGCINCQGDGRCPSCSGHEMIPRD